MCRQRGVKNEGWEGEENKVGVGCVENRDEENEIGIKTEDEENRGRGEENGVRVGGRNRGLRKQEEANKWGRAQGGGGVKKTGMKKNV